MPPRKSSKHFPLSIKSGSVTVKIYRDASKASGEYFRVVYRLGGKRVRLNFSTLEQAENEAKAVALKLARGDIDAVQLTGRDRLAYGRALEAIHGLGMPLDAAASEYAQAKKILGEASLVDAARFYWRHHGGSIVGKPVAEAVDAFIKEKATEGKSSLYLADLRYRLKTFVEAFHLDVRDLTSHDVRDFFAGLQFSPRSFNNHRRVIGTFLAFCHSRGWLAKEVNLLESVGKRQGAAADIEIFTPAELRSLLRAATPKLAACIALQAFAGIRSEEVLRLTWADLARRPGFVEVSARNAKTAQRRLIPVHPALAAWLSVAPKGAKRVWPDSKAFFFEAQRDAAGEAKVQWKANALRHSFISYRVAETKDVAAVALEGGNSPTIIFRHYRELATPQEATEWFSVLPDGLKNVVPIVA